MKDTVVYIVVEGCADSFRGLFTDRDRAHKEAKEVDGEVIAYYIDEDGDILSDGGFIEV